MIRYKILISLLCVTFSFCVANARIVNPSIFQGEQSFGTIAGAPLSTDANNQVISGIPLASAYDDSNFTCTTTDQVITGVTIAAPAAGTWEAIMSGDVSSATAGIVVTFHFQMNNATATHGSIKLMPFAGGTLTSGSQRVPWAKSIQSVLNGTNAVEIWCSTSSGTVTVANTALVIKRLL